MLPGVFQIHGSEKHNLINYQILISGNPKISITTMLLKKNLTLTCTTQTTLQQHCVLLHLALNNYKNPPPEIDIQ